MPQELLYTSVPSGLDPDRHGFCTVQRTRGVSASLQRILEGLSGLDVSALTGSARRTGVFNGTWLATPSEHVYVLTRLSPAGDDYSGRPNKLVHHVVLTPDEFPASGPARLAQAPGLLKAAWDHSICELSPLQIRGVPTTGVQLDEWRRLVRDPGVAGLVWGYLSRQRQLPVWIIVPESADRLKLVAEAMSLVAPVVQWETSFSTEFQSLIAGTTCQLRLVSAESQTFRNAPAGQRQHVLDLTRGTLAIPPELQSFAALARAGRLIDLGVAASRDHSGSAQSRLRESSDRSVSSAGAAWAGDALLELAREERREQVLRGVQSPGTVPSSPTPQDRSASSAVRQDAAVSHRGWNEDRSAPRVIASAPDSSTGGTNLLTVVAVLVLMFGLGSAGVAIALKGGGTQLSGAKKPSPPNRGQPQSTTPSPKGDTVPHNPRQGAKTSGTNVTATGSSAAGDQTAVAANDGAAGPDGEAPKIVTIEDPVTRAQELRDTSMRDVVTADVRKHCTDLEDIYRKLAELGAQEDLRKEVGSRRIGLSQAVNGESLIDLRTTDSSAEFDARGLARDQLHVSFILPERMNGSQAFLNAQSLPGTIHLPVPRADGSGDDKWELKAELSDAESPGYLKLRVTVIRPLSTDSGLTPDRNPVALYELPDAPLPLKLVVIRINGQSFRQDVKCSADIKSVDASALRYADRITAAVVDPELALNSDSGVLHAVDVPFMWNHEENRFVRCDHDEDETTVTLDPSVPHDPPGITVANVVKKSDPWKFVKETAEKQVKKQLSSLASGLNKMSVDSLVRIKDSGATDISRARGQLGAILSEFVSKRHVTCRSRLQILINSPNPPLGQVEVSDDSLTLVNTLLTDADNKTDLNESFIGYRDFEKSAKSRKNALAARALFSPDLFPDRDPSPDSFNDLCKKAEPALNNAQSQGSTAFQSNLDILATAELEMSLVYSIACMIQLIDQLEKTDYKSSELFKPWRRLDKLTVKVTNATFEFPDVPVDKETALTVNVTISANDAERAEPSSDAHDGDASADSPEETSRGSNK